MATTALEKGLSPIQEIVELGGEVIVKGLSKQQFYQLSEHHPELLDKLKKLQKKMKETWIKNGVRLAWLIDPYEEKAHICRADGNLEVIADFDQQLSGEEVLPGFALSLSEFRLLG